MASAGLAAALAVGSAQETPTPAVAEIVARMQQSETAQEKNLPCYRTIRTYHLTNQDGSKTVDLVAQVDYSESGEKSIQVLEERGSEGLFRRALRKVLEAEIRGSQKGGREETRLGPQNYEFRLLGTEMKGGRRCYVLQLKPRRKSKYLIDGRAWVDAEAYALVELEGRPAASVSFWIGKPHIAQSYEKVGDHWLLARNHSEADARLIGKIALTIETRDIEMDGTRVTLAARRHAPVAAVD